MPEACTLRRALFNMLAERDLAAPATPLLEEDEDPALAALHCAADRLENRMSRSHLHLLDAEDAPLLPLGVSQIPEEEEELPQEAEEELPQEAREGALPRDVELMEREEGAPLGNVRGTLRQLIAKEGTLRGETLQVEKFRVVFRDPREQLYRPLANVEDLNEEEKDVRMKAKRMIRLLRNDPENDLRVGWRSVRFVDSMIILDFMRGRGPEREWYVLQCISSDLSGWSLF